MLAVLFALASMQGPTPAQGPLYRYRLEVKTSREVDQTAIGRANLSEGLTTVATISVTARDSAEGQIVEVTVDSMTLDPTGALVDQLQQHPAAAHDARGARVSQYVVRGRIHGPAIFSDSTNQALGAIAQAISVLFPGVRRGAKVGDSWADTTNLVNGKSPQQQTHGQILAQWKVVGVEGNALVLDGTSTSRTRTDDASNGQAMTLNATTREHVVIPPSGPVRRATIETSNDMSIAVPGLAAPIPGKTTASLSLTPLP
jgi:hypothetical protein